MTVPWWVGVPRAEASVPCGEAIHRLRWEDAHLHALDHDDPEGERALAALGGEPCACVEMLDAWARHAQDPGVLVLGSRGAVDVIAPEQERQGSGGWYAYGAGMPARPARPGRPVPRRLPARGGVNVARAVASSGASFAGITQRLVSKPGAPGPPSPPDGDGLAALLALGGGLGRRLDATVAAHWRERDPGEHRALLHAALYGRVLAALGPWLGQSEVELDLRMADPEAPRALAQREQTIIAELPFDWLLDVWARGLETIWGRFCLAVTTEDGRSWELLTVGPDLGEPSTVTLTLPA